MEKHKQSTRTKPKRSLDRQNDLHPLMYGKVPPQAKDLEDAVLGAIMLEKNAIDTATEILRPECFYVGANQRIFIAMLELQKKGMPTDMLTVAEELRTREELEMVGGPYYITRLTNAVVSAANIEFHCRIILQKFLQREIIRISGELISEAYEDCTDVFELLDAAEKRILSIGTDHLHSEMVDMSTVMQRSMEQIDVWRHNDSTITGVPSGFSDLDRATRGWQPGDLIILAARPSVGKTALALNIIRNAALGDKKVAVAVWSLEMKAMYLGLRLLASESGILLHKIQTGRLDDQELKDLVKNGVEKLVKARIKFDEGSNINLRTLTAQARRLKKKGELGLIVIDYLQLMSGEEKSGNREQEIAKISRGLKNLAQELQVPIIALSQLSRENAKAVTWESGPPMYALRESGAIEQDADMVMMLWGPSDEDINRSPELNGKRKVKIAKQRNGVVLTVTLDFRNEIQLFEAIDKQIKPQAPPGLIPLAQAEAKFTFPVSNFPNDFNDDDAPF
jgi:replicative DNA helicase